MLNYKLQLHVLLINFTIINYILFKIKIVFIIKNQYR